MEEVKPAGGVKEKKIGEKAGRGRHDHLRKADCLTLRKGKGEPFTSHSYSTA